MGENAAKSKEKHRKREPDVATIKRNRLAQFFEFSFASLIFYLVFISEFQIMSVHVFSMNVGWIGMMVQGLLVFHSINPLFSIILGRDKVFIHWVIEAIALIAATIGVASSYTDKVNKNKEHFITWHAIFGITGYALSMISGVNGTVTLYRKELKNYISPKFIKFMHILTGTLGFFFGALSLIMSCFTKWFTQRTNGRFVTLVAALLLVSFVCVWTLYRPIQKVWSNWNKLISNEEPKSHKKSHKH